MIEWTRTYGVLQEYAELILKEYRDRLSNDADYPYPNRNASGNLSNHLSYTLQLNDRSLQITISLEDYWKYIEYGTKPHFPPMEDIRQWIKVKDITPRTEQLTFLICRSISRKGTKGTEPFHKAYQSAFDKMGEVLKDAIAADYKDFIRSNVLALG